MWGSDRRQKENAMLYRDTESSRQLAGVFLLKFTLGISCKEHTFLE